MKYSYLLFKRNYFQFYKLCDIVPFITLMNASMEEHHYGYSKFTKQTPFRIGKPVDSYEGLSANGMVVFATAEYKFASWNVMGEPCRTPNNPQCVTETFATYKERILGSAARGGLLPYLMQRLADNNIGIAALQEAAFLQFSSPMDSNGVTQSNWDSFRVDCQALINKHGFSILKSDNLANKGHKGKGCAILYNQGSYTSIDCTSEELLIYAQFTDNKTKRNFYLASLHRDYDASASENIQVVEAFANTTAKSISQTKPVFIMGDWSFPCISVPGKVFGIGACTGLGHSEQGYSHFVFTDKRLGNLRRSYNWLYRENNGAKDTSLDVAGDIYLPSVDGGAYCIEDGYKLCIDNATKTRVIIRDVCLTDKAIYSFHPNAYIGILALAAPVIAHVTRYCMNRQEYPLFSMQKLIMANPYLTLASTAASMAIIYFSTERVVEVEIVDQHSRLTKAFKYGAPQELTDSRYC